MTRGFCVGCGFGCCYCSFGFGSGCGKWSASGSGGESRRHFGSESAREVVMESESGIATEILRLTL
jgi:hypothetical protein